MNVTVGKVFFFAVGFALIFAGGFILWQQINQPSTNQCYVFPMGTFTVFGFLKAYQGSCGFNSLPNYYASDIALSLQVLGLVFAFASNYGDGEVTIG